MRVVLIWLRARLSARPAPPGSPTGAALADVIGRHRTSLTSLVTLYVIVTSLVTLYVIVTSLVTLTTFSYHYPHLYVT